MLIDIKVPPLSESVAEATLLAWHKKVGEAVKRDENLIDIETDKVVLELPAPADGVLAKIIKGDGGTVKAGEVIATLDTEAKAGAAAPAVQVQAKAAPAPVPAAKPTPAAAPAMPSARKRAEEISDRQRLDRRQRHRLPRLLRHRHRRGQLARPRRAHSARRGPDELRGSREENRRLRQARPGRQAHDRGAHRRNVLDLERRRVRLDALHPDHQPAAIGDPGRARDARAAGGRERPGGDPAGQLPRALLRPPHRRRPRSGAVAGGDQGGARGSRALASRSVSLAAARLSSSITVSTGSLFRPILGRPQNFPLANRIPWV